MYGTRDAPQIWAKEVQKVMEGLGFAISMFQPSVYHPSKDLNVVVHVDDFLCSGEMKELEWLYDNLAQKFELKKSLIMKDSETRGQVPGPDDMSDIPSCCCRSGLCNNARMWTRR